MTMNGLPRKAAQVGRDWLIANGWTDVHQSLYVYPNGPAVAFTVAQSVGTSVDMLDKLQAIYVGSDEGSTIYLMPEGGRLHVEPYINRDASRTAETQIVMIGCPKFDMALRASRRIDELGFAHRIESVVDWFCMSEDWSASMGDYEEAEALFKLVFGQRTMKYMTAKYTHPDVSRAIVTLLHVATVVERLEVPRLDLPIEDVEGQKSALHQLGCEIREFPFAVLAEGEVLAEESETMTEAQAVFAAYEKMAEYVSN